MKIYVAAKFEERAVLRLIVRSLTDLGHEVTAAWITREELHLPQHMIALEDLRGVDEADLVILDTTYPGGSGREVEFGYALAKGKKVWMLGPFVNVFHYHQGVQHFNDWIQVVLALKGV